MTSASQYSNIFPSLWAGITNDGIKRFISVITITRMDEIRLEWISTC